jgi:hypothetical protein
MKKFIEWYAWYGTCAIILAYALLSFSMLKSTDLTYQILNGTGALGLVINAFGDKDYQAGVLNIVWTIIACVAIIKIFLM